MKYKDTYCRHIRASIQNLKKKKTILVTILERLMI